MKKFFEFNPFELFDLEKPKDKSLKTTALEEASDALKSAMLDYISKGSSPVSGGSWKRSLSKEYAKYKKEQGGSGIADLELFGDMLSDMIVEPRGNKIVVGFGSTQQAKKADGHNHSGIFGDSELPYREFIPKEGENFKRQILSELKSIIKDNLKDDG